ncbi:MAG: AtpZ/AtpI family protein [Planctomycetes bacterium]|nr:AtpZ/AtpI family protein [Planctomycetota bacterium]
MKRNDSDLFESVERHRRRQDRWEQEGERSLARNLAMVGSIGWTVVTPTLLGILAGRYVDRTFETGIMWTAALLVVGLTLGCRLAWRGMHHE